MCSNATTFFILHLDLFTAKSKQYLFYLNNLNKLDLLIHSVEQANKNYFGNRQVMRAQIEQLVETVTMNIGYPISLENLGILHDHSFYFDICLIIFPELNIKIIKISEESSFTESQKLQKLLELLTEELQINLVALSATQILAGHSAHLYHFLNVLKQFSYLPPSRPSILQEGYQQRTNSCPFLHKIQKNTKQPQSARQDPKQRNLSPSQSSESRVEINQQNEQIFEEIKNDSVRDDAERSKMKVKRLQKQKNPVKDSKKILSSKKIVKNGENGKNVRQVSKKYTNSLQKLMGDKNKNKSNRKLLINTGQNKRKRAEGEWKREIKEIDSVFKSFQLKLRDEKKKYLIKMQKLIREQQLSRMRQLQNRRRQKQLSDGIKYAGQISQLNEENRIRLKQLKQRERKTVQKIVRDRKQEEGEARRLKKELKVRKSKQIKQIQNCIKQLNERIFIRFEEGSQFQDVLMRLYRKFL